MTAILGYDSLLQIQVEGFDDEFTDVAEITNITPPAIKYDVVDITHRCSANGYREFTSTNRDLGNCGVEMSFVPGSASDDRLWELMTLRSVRIYRVVYPNRIAWTFTGELIEYNQQVGLDGRMTAQATIRLSSFPVVGVFTESKFLRAGLPGSGLISINTIAKMFAYATLPGSGVLSAYAGVRNLAAIAIPGAGALSCIATVPGQPDVWPGNAVFTGVGSLSVAMPLQWHAAQATVAGVGNLSVAIAQRHTLSQAATFAGSGLLQATLLKLSATVWDEATKDATATITGGGLVLTDSTSSNTAARANASASSGKLYCEFTTGATIAGGVGFGIVNASQSASSTFSTTTNGIEYLNDGTVRYNSSTLSTIETFGATTVISMAVDIDNAKIWFRKGSGNWNNSGTADPATNTEGIALSVASGPYMVAAECRTNAAISGRFKATYAQSVPSGFSDWIALS